MPTRVMSIHGNRAADGRLRCLPNTFRRPIVGKPGRADARSKHEGRRVPGHEFLGVCVVSRGHGRRRGIPTLRKDRRDTRRGNGGRERQAAEDSVGPHATPPEKKEAKGPSYATRQPALRRTDTPSAAGKCNRLAVTKLWQACRCQGMAGSRRRADESGSAVAKLS